MGKKTPKTDLGHIAEGLRSLAVPVGDLIYDPENARKHSSKNIASIQASLSKFGQRTPLVINKRNQEIEKGNGTLAAARMLGWTHIAAVFVEDEPGTQRGYSLADNRTSELADWNLDELGKQLQELKAEDWDLNDLGWDDKEFAKLVPSEELVDPEPQIHKAEELREKWGVETGQVWLVKGKMEHRVLCGDATNEVDVGALLCGAKPFLCVTDPPYGVNYDPDWRAKSDKYFGHLKGTPIKGTGEVSNDDIPSWTVAYRRFREEYVMSGTPPRS